MADGESAETFVLIGVIVGVEFRRVKFLLVAAVSKILKISATHVVIVIVWLV